MIIKPGLYKATIRSLWFASDQGACPPVIIAQLRIQSQWSRRVCVPIVLTTYRLNTQAVALLSHIGITEDELLLGKLPSSGTDLIGKRRPRLLVEVYHQLTNNIITEGYKFYPKKGGRKCPNKT